jgi:hypothetical protein
LIREARNLADQPEEKRKIIVDEDWKTQVERERASAKAAPSQPAQAGDAKRAPVSALPPASFELLITTLATQALMFLGQIPDPESQQPTVNLELAHHQIDMLGVLETKTRGNLSPDEANALESILHQLRMIYVAVRDQLAK